MEDYLKKSRAEGVWGLGKQMTIWRPVEVEGELQLRGGEM